MRLLIYGDIGGSGGYLRYCAGLLASGRLPEDAEVVLIGGKRFCSQLPPLDRRLRVIGRTEPESTSRLLRYLWHGLLFPALVTRLRPDVEFYPAGMLRPPRRSLPRVATCHNLLLFDKHELGLIGDSAERGRLIRYRQRQAQSLLAAAGVLFQSEHSCTVVTDALPGVVRHAVVPHGLEDEFLRSDPRAYDLPGEVSVLYVSSIQHYKYHPNVVRALRLVRRETGCDVRLRLAGSGSPGALRDLDAAIAAERALLWVDKLGELDRKTLLQEFRAADIFVFASSCETFGISLLEAMGARLPIACSNKSGLPGLLGDAGVYFDPTDEFSVAAAVTELLGSAARRKQLGEAAFQQARTFTWDRCASETWAFVQSFARKSAASGR